MSADIKKSIQKYRQAGLTLLIMSLVVLVGWLAWHHFHQTPATKTQQLGAVLSKVGKLMILPNNESPTLATITDKTKLTDKFLVSKSDNKDRVLIYPKNHMVIIYRPSINKIVAVGNVTGDPALAQAQGTSLTVLNSTNNLERTQNVITAIKAAYPKLKVINGGKTNRKDFPNTIVIDNTDQKPELRVALMKTIPGKQGFLPSSEDTPKTDFLVIVGTD